MIISHSSIITFHKVKKKLVTYFVVKIMKNAHNSRLRSRYLSNENNMIDNILVNILILNKCKYSYMMYTIYI